MNDSIWFWLYFLILVGATVQMVFNVPLLLTWAFFRKQLGSWASTHKETPDVPVATNYAVDFINEAEARRHPVVNTRMDNLRVAFLLIVGVVMTFALIFFIYSIGQTIEEGPITAKVKLEALKLLYPQEAKWNIYWVSILLVCVFISKIIDIMMVSSALAGQQTLDSLMDLSFLPFQLVVHDFVVLYFLSSGSDPEIVNYLWTGQISAVYDFFIAAFGGILQEFPSRFLEG